MSQKTKPKPRAGKKNKKEAVPAETVHRRLSVTTPLTKGKDVEILQGQINKQYRHFKIDRQIETDGELGPATFNAAYQVAKSMGAVKVALDKFEAGRISLGAQKLIRGREKSQAEKVLTKKRDKYRQKLRKAYNKTAGEKAVAAAQKFVNNTVEIPDGSNWGGDVEKFIRFTGYSGPVYWCGCFACYVVVGLGGANIPSKIRLGYAGYVESDARNNTNGLTAVSASQARAGDIASLWNNEHIVVVTSGVDSSGNFNTIEGNTSPSASSGDQANGGGVYAKTRNVADVDVFARPAY